MLTKTSYSLVCTLFNKHPTGKMVLRLEGDVMYEVIRLDEPMVMVVAPYEVNPYGNMQLIPANLMDLPEDGWEFLAPNGEVIKIYQRTEFYTNTGIYHNNPNWIQPEHLGYSND